MFSTLFAVKISNYVLTEPFELGLCSSLSKASKFNALKGYASEKMASNIFFNEGSFFHPLKIHRVLFFIKLKIGRLNCL